ncbi:hypothetical protein AMATHDRAFT_45531 [Amanita thiersii Skay4041]|uniref:GATA-type domain-containing protein n=1 Tax=Amanita thiersii Skay4041 TaxID=703135 RepID=A0A2A9NXT5_9AGAR|nr:hypothetical protein AMATHDRAFT_45531 [Amanita thiersii Skay4041]
MTMYGTRWENTDHPLSPQIQSDHSVNNASLKDDATNFTTPIDPALNHSSMPHRVEPYPMNSQHRRDHYENPHRRPSPPPISTLTHSPSPSIPQDRSAISTPSNRRSPASHSLPTLHSASYYTHDPALLQSSRHHPPPPSHYPSRADSMTHNYGFATHPPPFDHRYDHSDGSSHSPYHNSVALPSHATIPPVSHLPANHLRDSYSHSYPMPGQAPVGSIYTDDASTKLSDRVRRRCFNCCTTDTSTWRRSNLSPGKVLCNKCGLFERTHSRPRPEQFPHKRGPLTGTALSRPRTPPTNQLPPISPPYSYTHPSIAPLNNVQDHHRRDFHHHHHHHQQQQPLHPHHHQPQQQQLTQLPGLQSWHTSNPADQHSHGGHGTHTHGHGHGPTPTQSASTSHQSAGTGPVPPPLPTPGLQQQPPPPPQSLSSSPSSSQQPPGPPSRRNTGDLSPGDGNGQPSSPSDVQSASATAGVGVETRDSPKSVV